MRAEDVMTRNPVTVTPATSATAAIKLLAEHDITSAPVVNEDGDVVGMVSELDLLRDRLPHDVRSSMRRRDSGPDPAKTVEQVMTTPVVCLDVRADARDVADVLANHGIRAVPVLNDSGLIGIISRRDLLRTLIRDDEAITADVQRELESWSAGNRTHGRWKVQVRDGIVTVSGRGQDERSRETVEALVHAVPGVVRVHVR